jgi:four helix bundle protein
MRTHKDLDVWRAAVALARQCYGVTGTFPKSEQFGLTTQIRRSSVSIASNIAEGAARRGKREFIQYLYVAAGSARELDTQIEIAKGLFGRAADLNRLQLATERISMMLRGLIRSLAAPR